LTGSPGSARPSYNRTFYKALEATKIISIPCVQSRAVCVGGSCDQQVHYASTRLPARLHNASRQQSIAFHDRLVDRTCATRVCGFWSERPSEVILV